MFSHVMIGSNDLERSRTFYDALFAVMGARPGIIDPKGRLLYIHNGGRFFISPPINGEPATCANGGTIGFVMSSPEQARAWQQAGVENGGVAIEDPPGERASPFGALYLAYMRDPDGNKLCAVCRFPAPDPAPGGATKA
jgi:catechol 2,3-dioxygenase-like lactoylglutathione lyase family enzyme